MIECVPIQFPDEIWCLCCDGGCARNIIEKSKLTEGFTWLVDFEVGGSIARFENLGAVKWSTLENVHAVTFVTLFDDGVALRTLNFFNCIDNSLELLII